MHLQELGISTLTACFVNANRDPKKGEPAKPSDFFYFLPQEDKDKLSGTACDAFFSLVTDEKMPSWAIALAPIEKMRSSRVNGSIPQCRAWVKKGVLLITPLLDGTKVRVPLALIDGVDGAINLIDIDSGNTYKITISNPKGEIYWMKDAEFELADTAR